MKESIRNIFLIIRPYSIADVMLLGILGNVLVTGNILWNETLLRDMFYSLLWWASILLAVEYRKNDGISRNVVFAFGLITGVVTIYLSLIAFVILIINIFLLYVYSLKSKNEFMALISPFPRGCLSATLILIVAAFHNSLDASFIMEHAGILSSILFVTAARNLEGDIRDISVDKKSLAKSLGRDKSRVIVLFLIGISSILIGNPTVIPLLLFMALVMIKHEEPTFHRIFVITTTFFSAEYILYLIGYPLQIINLLYIGMLLNFTYPYVPRTKNLSKRNLHQPKGRLRWEK